MSPRVCDHGIGLGEPCDKCREGPTRRPPPTGYCAQLIASLRMEAAASGLAAEIGDPTARRLWREGWSILSKKLNAAANLLEEQFARITDLEIANGIKRAQLDQQAADERARADELLLRVPCERCHYVLQVRGPRQGPPIKVLGWDCPNGHRNAAPPETAAPCGREFEFLSGEKWKCALPEGHAGSHAPCTS